MSGSPVLLWTAGFPRCCGGIGGVAGYELREVLLVVGLTVLRLAVLGIRGSDMSLEDATCGPSRDASPKESRYGRRCYSQP